MVAKVKYPNNSSQLKACNLNWVYVMVSEGKGRLFRRKDGKYLIYLPKDLAEDSVFPFQTTSSVRVKVRFEKGKDRLIIEKF